jgi:hypothetical protein
MKSKISILIIFFLVFGIISCLLEPNSNKPNDSGDGGDDIGDSGDTGPNDENREYSITIGFDSFVSSQYSYDALPDEIVVSISHIQLFEGHKGTTITLDEPIELDFKKMLTGEQSRFIPVTLKKKGIFDKVRLHLSKSDNANYITSGDKTFPISSNKDYLDRNMMRLNRSRAGDLYFEAIINPRMDVSDCLMNYVSISYDLITTFFKNTNDTYQIDNRGLLLDYLCTPMENGFEYQILMGFDATLSDDYPNPPSNVVLKIVGVELTDDEGTYRYDYAQPQEIDLIDTLLEGYYDIAPIIVKAGIYNRVKLILSEEEYDNYVTINDDDLIYPLLMEDEEPLIELPLSGNINMVECKQTYLMTSFNLTENLHHETIQFRLLEDAVSADTMCNFSVTENQVLSAVIKKTQTTRGINMYQKGDNAQITISHKYVKVIDGIRYTRIDQEPFIKGQTAITIIMTNDRIQIINMDTGVILSDTDFDIEENIKGHDFYKTIKNNDLSLIDFKYDVKLLESLYKDKTIRITDRNNGNDLVILSDEYEGDEPLLQGCTYEATYDEELGVLIQENIKTPMEHMVEGQDNIDLYTVKEYTYQTFGNYLCPLTTTITMTYDMRLGDFVSDETADRLSDKYDYSEETVETLDIEEYENAIASGAVIRVLPDPKYINGSDAIVDFEVKVIEEVKNINITNIEDSFFMFKENN